MRDFAQPRVLKLAALAALASCLLCYPALADWPKRPLPVWYLEVAIFCCATVLWGFVFAWHSRYTNRPVITLRIDWKSFVAATLAGSVIAMVFGIFLDPALRKMIPDDYPHTLEDWLAKSLFSLGLTQLFIVFAPFDWLMRLSKRQRIATFGVIVVGVIVLMTKNGSAKTPVTPMMLCVVVCGRTIVSYLAVQCYLRGGLLLASWLALVIEARHLLNLK